jgi:uncharacterized protein (TIRG00374 family)
MTGMKKFMVILVLFLGIAVVVLSFGELEKILETLKSARPLFLLIAIVIQLGWFFVLGRMYQSVFHLLGVEEPTLTLTRIASAANFLNIVAPTAGMGGIALFAAEARRRGHPAGKATVGTALSLLLDQAAFICVLAVGFIILVRRNDLDAGKLTASVILIVSAIGYTFILYLGYRSEKRLGDLLASIARFLNRIVNFLFRKENYLSEVRAHRFAHEVAEGFAGLTERPTSLVRPVMWGILSKVLLMGVLLCAFLAFDVPLSAGTIVAGFCIGYLFLIVSPTPSGIGIVEGIMPLALTSLSVDWSQAVVITLTYRTVTFWLPFGVGAWAFRSLHLRGRKPDPEEALN